MINTLNINKLVNAFRFYGFLGVVRIFIGLILSSIFLKIGILVKWPFYVRSIGSIKFGNKLLIGEGLVIDIFERDSILYLGDSLRAGRRLHIGVCKKISIGKNVLIADDVFISDHTHGSYSGDFHDMPEKAVNERKLAVKPVFVGDNVWLGNRVCVFPGANIGENSIIGANSIVIGSIPSNCIAVGIPAKVIKTFDRKTSEWLSVNE